MRKRTITISFETDAPDEVVQEIAEQMRWQLDSLNDGTLEMDVDADPADYDYIHTDTKIT